MYLKFNAQIIGGSGRTSRRSNEAVECTNSFYQASDSLTCWSRIYLTTGSGKLRLCSVSASCRPKIRIYARRLPCSFNHKQDRSAVLFAFRKTEYRTISLDPCAFTCRPSSMPTASLQSFPFQPWSVLCYDAPVTISRVVHQCVGCVLGRMLGRNVAR